ncbi:MAG: biotin-dependent carboxyltransferase family protein, partial [Propionibacteriaceae bacterium]|nr:biotin-dependent carboxyltransferase family protein [Propionibacteriaceae bacterium]
GHTDAVLWDLSREHPALLNPGDKVKYVAVRESLPLNPTSQHPHLPPFQRGWQAKPDGGLSPAPQQTPAGTAYLEIITPGWLALIEDGGRPGMLGLGVSVSGAADQSALRAANLALGNPPTTAAIETLGGLELLAHGTVTVAVAPPAAPVQVMQLSDGDTLQVPTPTTGVRSYVAVAGGIAVLPVLGNCSTDLLSGIGPAPLRAGDVLLLANPQQKPPNLPTPAPAPPTAETLIRITLGPRDDWLTATALASLTEQIWEVSNESNRVGLRLIGEPLQRAITRELPSEGTQPGAIQVPPNGLPVVFLRDHPVTGGYPVVAVVAEEDLDILAQTRPAENLRFVVA